MKIIKMTAVTNINIIITTMHKPKEEIEVVEIEAVVVIEEALIVKTIEVLEVVDLEADREEIMVVVKKQILKNKKHNPNIVISTTIPHFPNQLKNGNPKAPPTTLLQ